MGNGQRGRRIVGRFMVMNGCEDEMYAPCTGEEQGSLSVDGLVHINICKG
jgi:hypothetical protein